MLKQEEALAELDVSIDNWISKYEQVENRRTRVRQKLLEHLCAAMTLAVPSTTATQSAPAVPPASAGSTGCETHQNVSDVEASSWVPSMGGTTFPMTHVRTASGDSVGSSSSDSSHCGTGTSTGAGAQVPNGTIIKQPTVKEMAATLAPDDDDDGGDDDGGSHTSRSTHGDAESIRVYADSDVYALIADVESDFTRMSTDSGDDKDESDLKTEKEICHARSEELLVGANNNPTRFYVPAYHRAMLTPMLPRRRMFGHRRNSGCCLESIEESEEELVYLTDAVFTPNRP